MFFNTEQLHPRTLSLSVPLLELAQPQGKKEAGVNCALPF